MASAKESKIDCTVTFTRDDAPGESSKPLDSVLHLFEQSYDEHIKGFWYGVVEIACDFDDIAITMPAPQEAVMAVVALADGRRAGARYTKGHLRMQDGVKIYRMGLVGISDLV